MKLNVRTGVSLLCLSAALSLSRAEDAGTNAAPKKSPWALSSSLGLTLTRGNSHTLLAVGNLHAVKKWEEKNEADLGADFAYGQNNGVKSADSDHAYAQYNRALSDRFFAYLRVDGLHDDIAKIDYRLTVSPGAGYYLVKTTNTTLRIEFGPAFIDERLNGASSDFATLRVAERFEQKFNTRVRFWESVEFLPEVDKFSNYIINAEIGLETAMTKHLSQQTYIQDNYNSEPAAGREKNDTKLVAAISYKL